MWPFVGNPRRMTGVSRPMSLLKRLALGLVPAIALIAMLATPAPSLASCAVMPDVKLAATAAEIAFVGTVTATANRDTWATVSVEEVWRGPDQPAQVVIKGGPEGNAATSVDRTFQVGVKYLFFPYTDGAAGLADNSCTSTTAWAAELAALRPADARVLAGGTPTATGFDFNGVLGPIVVAVVVAGALLVVGLLARSRQPG